MIASCPWHLCSLGTHFEKCWPTRWEVENSRPGDGTSRWNLCLPQEEGAVPQASSKEPHWVRRRKACAHGQFPALRRSRGAQLPVFWQKPKYFSPLKFIRLPRSLLCGIMSSALDCYQTRECLRTLQPCCGVGCDPEGAIRRHAIGELRGACK